jgi:hypothetical protein
MPKLSRLGVAKLSVATVSVALLLCAPAFGQATRTWVSGVGDDVNPCSRTAPCKTFAGAISKTATGGIINAMDDGGFGALTITKGITVDGGSHTAGMLASGGINAINVNAPGAYVVLRNLDIEGNGTTLGLNGVNIIAARVVKIVHSDIGFFSRSGVLLNSSSNPTRVVLIDTRVHDNGGNGVTVAAQNGTTATGTIRRSDLDDNACGAMVTNFAMSNDFTTECGAGAPNGGTGVGNLNIFRTSIGDNFSRGVEARGGTSIARISANDIAGSNYGVRALDGGTIQTWGNNVFGNNGANTAPGTTMVNIGPLL